MWRLTNKWQSKRKKPENHISKTNIIEKEVVGEEDENIGSKTEEIIASNRR